MGYTFLKENQGAFRSAADGVVIYAQNWKPLLKNAAKTTLIVIVILALLSGAAFLVIGGLFRWLHWNLFVAFLLAAMVAYAVKFAFVDSWILVKTMEEYMRCAQSTQISYDLYGNLCNLSAKFKELFHKGQSEDGGQAAYSVPSQPILCWQCAAQNASNAIRCSTCSAVLQQQPAPEATHRRSYNGGPPYA